MQTDRSRLLVPFSHVSRQLDRKQCQEESVMRDLERVPLAPNTLGHTSPQKHTELIYVCVLPRPLLSVVMLHFSRSIFFCND